MMYSKETHSIRVTVTPRFLEDESMPGESHFVWIYHIKIENVSKVSVQLLKRQWFITDGSGVTREVSGEGVIGEKPILDPGDVYEYTSGVPLSTPSGIMTGFYDMISEYEEEFQIEIPTFSLDSPFEFATVH